MTGAVLVVGTGMIVIGITLKVYAGTKSFLLWICFYLRRAGLKKLSVFAFAEKILHGSKDVHKKFTLRVLGIRDINTWT